MIHLCGLEVTYCEKCGDELEVGQTGHCDTCREYTFAELSDAAKQKARENYTGQGYLDYEWWDSVYEDARRVATMLGIYNPDIYFTGFSSQGDGACFNSNYTFNDKAVEKIKEHCEDEELIRIASELTGMQTLQRLRGLESFSALITTRGHGCHSGTMQADITDWGYEEIGEPDEKQFLKLMRDFADWIYKSLEAENDYLYSDECVDQYLVDERFDESGTMI